MPINQLWQGQSTTFGNTLLGEGSVISLEEGYNTSAGDEYVSLGNVIIDRITHNRNNNQDTLSIVTGAANKRLQDYVTDTAIDYSGYFYRYNEFNGPSAPIPSYLTQSASSFSLGQTMLQGVTPSTASSPEALTYGVQAYDSLMEAGFRFNGDAGWVEVGTRGWDTVANRDNKTSFVLTLVSAGADITGVYVKGQQGLSAYYTAAATINANTDYYARSVSHGSRGYGFWSSNGQDWTVVGNTYAQLTWLFPTSRQTAMNVERGYGFVGNANVAAAFGYLRNFSYSRVWTVGSLIEDIAKHANVAVHIPDYQNDLSSGFTTQGGQWGYTNGVLTAVGTSFVWDTYHTGLSYRDFQIEVDMKLNVGSIAGLMIGRTTNNFNGYFMIGYTPGQAYNTVLAFGAVNEKFLGGSRFLDRFPPVADFPYNDWAKLSIIKQGRALHLALNNQSLYYTLGSSGLNNDYNITGLMLRGDFAAGNTNSAQFRNLRIRPLSDVVTDFIIDSNQSLMGAIDSLKQVQPFDYRFTGQTMTVIPIRDTRSVRVFDVGLSNLNGQVLTNQDTEYNHVVVVGANNIRAEAFDPKSFAEKGERLFMTTDEQIDTYDSAYLTAQKILDDSNNMARQYQLRIPAHPDLEVGDVVTIIDNTVGISENMYISSLQKSYDPNGFSETITLEQL